MRRRARPSLFTVVLVAGLLVLAYFFSGVLQGREIRNQFISRVSQWELDIAQSLIAKDWMALGRRLDYLNTGELLGIELNSDGSVVYNWPVDFEANQCLIRWKAPISRYGLELGRLTVCLDLALLAKSTLTSPLFIVLAFGLLMLFLASSILALNRYRSGVVNLIDQLSRLDLAQDEIENAYRLADPDPVANKVWTLITRAMEERVAKETAQTEADAANRMSLMAARVAHDIRSPLSALKIALQLDPNNEAARELLRKATSRIHDISSELLNESRGKLKVSPLAHAGELRLCSADAEILQPLLMEFEHEAKEKGLQFSSDFFDQGTFLMCNPVEMQRAVSNIVSNAFDAVGPGGSIHLQILRVDGVFKIRVQDNGPGIPADVVHRLGTLGFSSKSGSTGMGLYFAKSEAQRCGGQVTITSVEGQGTIVTIELPVAVAAGAIVQRETARPAFQSLH